LGPWTYSIVGVVLAILGFAGVLVFASHGGGGGGTTPVVVAAQTINLRAKLTAEDLKLQDFTTSDVPPGAYTSVKSLIGQIAAVQFTTNEPILSNLVTASPSDVVTGATSYLPIAHGFVAVTIPATEESAVAGYVQAGDYISIIATFTPRGANYPTSRTIFTNVHVIRAGPAAANQVQSTSGTLAGSQNGGVTSSLTVVVSECDAEYLNWFLSYASVKYTLESYQDYQSQTTAPDASCPSVVAAKGVTSNDINTRWPNILTTH